MKALSLFSGIGGLELAAMQCGIQTIALCEIEPFPVAVLSKRFPDIPILSDVRKVDGHDYAAVDVIFGGFPCQDLSQAGKKAGLVDEKGNATRSGLWFEMLRIITEARPRFVVAENVRGAVNSALDTVTSGLEDADYKVWPYVIPASAVGAPHQRERLFVIAVRKDIWSSLADITPEGLQRSCESELLRKEWEKSNDQWPAGGSAVLWRTPAYSDWKGSVTETKYQERLTKKLPIKLEHQVAHEEYMWRTPDANMSRGAISEAKYQERLERGMPNALNYQVAHEERRWSTVTASSNERTGSTQYKPGSMHSANLGDIVTEVEGRRGQLNPDWVEQLMCYPSGWTNLDCDEPSQWMGWPACPGQQQFDYEYPRTVIGGKDRAKRLKALGNSVVPLQAFPVFKTVQYLDYLTRSVKNELP